MSAGHKIQHLEVDLKKLQRIINDLVKENYELRNLLQQKGTYSK
jgi:hypothetical protein